MGNQTPFSWWVIPDERTLRSQNNIIQRKLPMLFPILISKDMCYVDIRKVLWPTFIHALTVAISVCIITLGL